MGDERLVGEVAWEQVVFGCTCIGIDGIVFDAVVEFEFDSNVGGSGVELDCDSSGVEW
jgi:hypothetical protein